MKKILIALLVLSLVGGGAVMANAGVIFSPDELDPIGPLAVDDEEENGENDEEENENEENEDENGGNEEELGEFAVLENGENGEGEGIEDEELEEDERSEVAEAVHAALTDSTDLKPGDEGFGQAVSERAREGNLGAVVSAAARGANGSAGASNGANKSDNANKGNSNGNGN